MAGHTPWSEIRSRRAPDERAVEMEKLALKLALLREQAGLSQVELAERLGTSPSNVSQLEHQGDLRVSSIAKYVRATGGELRVLARFGDTTYTLVDDGSGDWLVPTE